MKLLKFLGAVEKLCDRAVRMSFPFFILSMLSSIACWIISKGDMALFYLFVIVVSATILTISILLYKVIQKFKEKEIKDMIIGYASCVMEENNIYTDVKCSKCEENEYCLKLKCSSELVDKITLGVMPMIEEYGKIFEEFFTIKTEVTYDN